MTQDTRAFRMEPHRDGISTAGLDVVYDLLSYPLLRPRHYAKRAINPLGSIAKFIADR